MKTVKALAFSCGLLIASIMNASESLRITTILSEPVGCNGATTGSLAIAAAGGQLPYSFAVGTPGAPVPPPNSTGRFIGLSAGQYSIEVTDSLGTLVTASAPVGITLPLALKEIAATSVSGPGINDATIVIVAEGGQLPLTFTLTDPSPTPPVIVGRTATFAGLAQGPHALRVTSQDNCPEVTAAIFNEAPGAFPVPLQISNIAIVQVGCNDASTGPSGSLTITAVGGSGNPANYRYALSGPVNRPLQPENLFSQLPAGEYTVDVIDTTDQALLTTSVVPVGNVEPLALVQTDIDAVACVGAATGTITVTTEGGHLPLAFTIAPVGGSFTQPSPDVGEFSNLSVGTYTVTINSADSCSTQTATVSVAQGFAPIVISEQITPQECLTGKLGTITVEATGGNEPFEFSINGSPLQSSNKFVDLEAGAYTITVRDASGCVALQQAIVESIRGVTGNPLTDYISGKYCNNEC